MDIQSIFFLTRRSEGCQHDTHKWGTAYTLYTRDT